MYNPQTPEEAYAAIGQIANRFGLVHQGAGGVLIIASVSVQKEEGLYCRCQYMAGLGKHPNQHLDNACTVMYCACEQFGKGNCAKREKRDR